MMIYTYQLDLHFNISVWQLWTTRPCYPLNSNHRSHTLYKLTTKPWNVVNGLNNVS